MKTADEAGEVGEAARGLAASSDRVPRPGGRNTEVGGQGVGGYVPRPRGSRFGDVTSAHIVRAELARIELRWILWVRLLVWFPSYAKLSPDERAVYLDWLHHVDSPIDIGYVFNLCILEKFFYIIKV